MSEEKDTSTESEKFIWCDLTISNFRKTCFTLFKRGLYRGTFSILSLIALPYLYSFFKILLCFSLLGGILELCCLLLVPTWSMWWSLVILWTCQHTKGWHQKFWEIHYPEGHHQPVQQNKRLPNRSVYAGNFTRPPLCVIWGVRRNKRIETSSITFSVKFHHEMGDLPLVFCVFKKVISLRGSIDGWVSANAIKEMVLTFPYSTNSHAIYPYILLLVNTSNSQFF